MNKSIIPLEEKVIVRKKEVLSFKLVELLQLMIQFRISAEFSAKCNFYRSVDICQ